MTNTYKRPGVFIEEVSRFPPSVVPVETAIPAFIGYTAKTRSGGLDLINRPVAIESLLEFEQIFGTAPKVGSFTVTVDSDGKVIGDIADPNDSARFRLAYALRHFYDNGGGRCYVISIDTGYDSPGSLSAMVDAHVNGLAALATEDEPTLIVFPDLGAMAISPTSDAAAVRAQYHSVLMKALDQCAALGDRFLICEPWDDDLTEFRNGIGTRNLKYGAAYYPSIQTTIPWNWDYDSITVTQLARRNDDGSLTQPSPDNGLSLTQLKTDSSRIFANVAGALDRYTVVLPPSPAVAGVYATVDRTRGVWKSPANESLSSVRTLAVQVDNATNEAMNIDASGKSINALRFFTGKGFLVWGSRTLAGNDNEWRYVSVRRFFNMVEESVKKASEPFVFEPNDANTWAKVRGMIENFLTLQWRQGALVGAKPEDAFYVRVGLGTTMTAQDILEGSMNVEIGMAVVRPAEFIVLQFSHKMQEA